MSIFEYSGRKEIITRRKTFWWSLRSFIFFFFLLLRSKHIYLKTEKNEEKNVADDSVGSCSQSRLKGGSPESLLSVVTRVSVGFNYSKSHLSETWSVEKWNCDIFFFLFIWNPASSLTAIRTGCTRLCSIRISFSNCDSIDSSQNGLTYNSIYIRYKNLTYICTHKIESNFVRVPRSIPRNFLSLGDLCASIATTFENPSKFVVLGIGLKEARRCSNNRPAPRIPRTALRWEHRWVPVTEHPRTRPMWPDIEGTRNTRPALDRGEARRMSSRLCPTLLLPQDRRTTDSLVDDRTTARIRVGLAATRASANWRARQPFSLDSLVVALQRNRARATRESLVQFG